MSEHLPTEGHALFSTAPPRRFFLIPDDAELPAGELTLSSLTGRELALDAEVAEIWAIEEAEAQGWAARKAKEIGGKVRAALSGAAAAPVDGAEAERRAAQRQRVADTLGITAEQLGRDPEAVKQGALRALSALRDELMSAAAKAPVDRERVEGRAAKLGDIARDEGMPELASAAERLPDALRALGQDPELVGRLREASAKLRAASAEMRAKRRRGE